MNQIDKNQNFQLSTKIQINSSSINHEEINQYLNFVKLPELQYKIINTNNISIDSSIKNVHSLIKDSFPEENLFSNELKICFPEIEKLNVEYKNCWLMNLGPQKNEILNAESDKNKLNEFSNKNSELSTVFSIYVPNSQIFDLLSHLQLNDFQIEFKDYKGLFSVYLSYFLSETVKKRELLQILKYLLENMENKSLKSHEKENLENFILFLKYIISEYTKFPFLHYSDILFNLSKIPEKYLISLLLLICKKVNLRSFSSIQNKKNNFIIIGDILYPRKGRTAIYCQNKFNFPIFVKRKINNQFPYLEENKIMIASGIGVLPFLSFIQEKNKNFKSLLLYAFKNENDDLTKLVISDYKKILYEGQKIIFNESENYDQIKKNSNILKIDSSSIIFINSNIYRLENVLKNMIFEKEILIYICGSHKMQRKVYDEVKEYENIFVDRWD